MLTSIKNLYYDAKNIQQKDPAACRAINVCVLRASNPASVGEGLKLHCSNQSANESGIIIRADSTILPQNSSFFL